MSASVLPIVDLAVTRDGPRGAPGAGAATVAAEIAAAFEDVGFLVVAGHGVPDDVIDRLHAVALEFFALPLDEKRRVRSPVSNLYQGYAHPGPNPGDHTSERQSYNVQRFDTVAEAHAVGYPSDLDGLFLEALWPEHPAGFAPAVRAYYAAMERLVGELLALIERGLGVSPGALTALMDRHLSNQAINYYSDDIDSGHDPSPYRFKAHHDGSLITVLYQDDGPGALQLYRRGHGWIDVDPVPGTVIVNTGEILTRLSNGRYPATPHRVLQPPPDALRVPRISAPFFVKPGLDAPIGPLPELLAVGDEPVAATMSGRDWYRRNQENIDRGYDSTRQYEDLAAEGDVPA